MTVNLASTAVESSTKKRQPGTFHSVQLRQRSIASLEEAEVEDGENLIVEN